MISSWSPPEKADWRPARVTPFISETALTLARDDDWRAWVGRGRIIERRAAGLERTVVFNPYPDAQPNGVVDADFRIEVNSLDGRPLAAAQARVKADNRDVVYIEDWSQVFQRDVLVATAAPAGRRWTWRTGLDAAAGASLGNALYGESPPDHPLQPLSYPLDLRGHYALFVCTSERAGIRLRLTGDERSDTIGSRRPHEEVLWRWTLMDRQHLVLRQPHTYTGYASAQIDYVKLVPLPPPLVGSLDARYGGEPDKLVAGYWEPYSWAFVEDVRETLQHREPLIAFQEARVGLLDIQIGRFGDKVVYESRRTDPLVYGTFGDPVEGNARPETNNVGRMQQYTNTLEAELRYARDLGLRAHANFGAGACYVGTPLQGDVTKKHPEWERSNTLRFEIPEVREYALSLYREALEIGADGISIDFCRYPEGVDTAETANTLLRELRRLADEFAKVRGSPVPVLIRFPGTGVRLHDRFDYPTWVREGLVDYLCPSNIQGRHLHIDVAPYLRAVRGTRTRLLPCVDGLGWGLPMPGPFLWRVAHLYRAGVDGVYVYQADGRILGRPEDRRCVRLLAAGRAVEQWWEEDRRERPRRSKGVYLSRPEAPGGAYHGWERLRVWTEGVEMGAVELYLDDKLVSRHETPPYLLGTEEYASDAVIPDGEHRLRVRARDGDGWLEQTFTIRGAR